MAELASTAAEIAICADIEQLFIRSPRASVSGETGPSNAARMRMFVRRLHAGGAGIAEEFLELVKRAFAHYGISNLEGDPDARERAVMRLLASQVAPGERQRIVLALIRQAEALVRLGVPVDADWNLDDAFDRLADMRGLVSDAVADAALDARYEVFGRPVIDAQLEQVGQDLETWFAAAESSGDSPPDAAIRDIADAPRPVFDRLARWVNELDPRRRMLALEAELQRLYSPLTIRARETSTHGAVSVVRAELSDDRVVVAAACRVSEMEEACAWLQRTAAAARDQHEWPAVSALELILAATEEVGVDGIAERLHTALDQGIPAARLTLSLVTPGHAERHQTFLPTRLGYELDTRLMGIHPEAAERIDLARLENFELERVESSEGIYAFKATAKDAPSDRRMVVLADVRARRTEADRRDEINPTAFEKAFIEATRAMRRLVAANDPNRRLQWNRIGIYCGPPVRLDPELSWNLTRRLWPTTRRLGLEKVIVRVRILPERPGAPLETAEFVVSDITGSNIDLLRREPRTRPLVSVSDYERKVLAARSRRLVYPYEIIRMLTGGGRGSGTTGGFAGIPLGEFEEYDLDETIRSDNPRPIARNVSGRAYGKNQSAVVFGVMTTPTDKHPEGLKRVLVLSDPTIGMGALAAPECDRIVAALDLAEAMRVPFEWIPVSSGAKIAMDSGTENLDATARVVKRIVEFTQNDGVMHLIVQGVNVGAQSYWNALSTMLMHTRGVLIMTPGASMVLTGRAALEASGAVSAEDEVAIGGFERIMGPNGQAQYYASDLSDAYRILYEHYRYSYVAPGEGMPRLHPTKDADRRSLREAPCESGGGADFRSVGEIFEDETNPGRKKPFPMRPVMSALVDEDGGRLERWNPWVGAETAIVWDAHLGGIPVTLIGIESQNVPREGYRPLDGPASWSGGTLFPQSSKKVARALNSASGNRPTVILANLSGFDGSPESLRKLQLEYGAEIARAVVNFDGPLLFMVVSRYHGGAYVVFSQELNPGLQASALEGAYASVIGGGPAAAVVFVREVRARVADDPRVKALQERVTKEKSPQIRAELDKVTYDVTLEKAGGARRRVRRHPLGAARPGGGFPRQHRRSGRHPGFLDRPAARGARPRERFLKRKKKRSFRRSGRRSGPTLLGEEDIEKMRVAGRLAAALLDDVATFIGEGVTTEDIDRRVAANTSDAGAISAPLGYRGFPKHCCTSVNDVVCHGIPTPDRTLKSGDIINVDVTPIVDGFHGDSSRTFEIGQTSPVAKRLVADTYRALWLGIRAVKDGGRTGDIGQAIQTFAEAQGYAVVREFTGHGIHSVFHTAPTIFHYGTAGQGDELRAGMSFTIEPMINLGHWKTDILDDGWTAVTQDGTLSAQFEHTVVITESEVEVMTLGAEETPPL